MQPQGGWVQPHITFVSQIDLQLYFCISQVCFPSVFLKEERVGCGHLRPHLTCVSQLDFCISQVCFSSVFLKEEERVGCGHLEVGCGLTSPVFLNWISVYLKCVSQVYFSRRKRGWDAATWRLGAASPHLPPGLGILQALPGSLQFSLSGAAASNQDPRL